MTMQTLKEIAARYAKQQPEQVDNLLENAPILDTVKWKQSSHAMWNVASELAEVVGASFVKMNAPLPQMRTTERMKKIDLDVLGGELELPEDTIRSLGGVGKAFSEREPKFLQKAGMDTEYAFVYNNFLPFASDCGNLINAGATTGDVNSIVAVRWVEGETCGLYSPEGFSKGCLLDVEPIDGGNTYHDSQRRLVKGVRYKAYFGLQLLNTHSVAAIVNINKDHIPTSAMLDELLEFVRADKKNTFIYLRKSTKNLLFSKKENVLKMTPADRNYSTGFDKWDEVPFITSYNMPKAETVVSV